MPIPDSKVRLQTIVDRKLARKIEDMANRMGIGQSRMIYYLLDAALQDEAWAARAIAGTFAKRVRTALRK
jgi:predicted O-linked N-acetylglucosamine transferase (SPINDLY family)